MNRRLQAQLLTWFGVAGCSIALATYCSGYIFASDCARTLLERSNAFQNYYWSLFSGILRYNFRKEVICSIALVVFWLSLTFGVILQSGKFRQWRFRGRDHYDFLILFNILLLIGLSTVYIELNYVGSYESYLYKLIYSIEFFILTLVIAEGTFTSKFVSGFIYTILYLILADYFVGLFRLYDAIVPSSAMAATLLAFSVVAAPNKALNRKVGYLLLGAAAILMLNEISKLAVACPSSSG